MILIHKLTKRDIDHRLQTSGLHISSLQYSVLRLLRHKMQTISDLSHKLLLEAATLVPVIDSLEQRGLLKRIPDRTDRRRNHLTVTEQGLQILGSLPASSETDLFTGAVATLPVSKQKELLQLLRGLVTKMSPDARIGDEVHEMACEEFARR